ncbi:MAG: cytochrome c [Ignavibacteria bacterium]|nr:cytochrome c [Ignavibacteria bacterium]
MLKTYLSILILTLSVLIYGCGKKEGQTTDNKTAPKSNIELVKQGKDLFYAPSSVTNLKCADCHSDGTNDSNPLTKFHSNIRGANKRTETYLGKFKGDEVKNNAGGATVCWTTYLKNKDAMTPEQIASLNAYYESVLWNEEVKNSVYTTIALPAPDKEKLKKDQEEIAKLTGDKAKGEEVFKNACKFCHMDGTKIKSVPSLFRDFEGNLKSITYMTRFGKKYMPFFSYESISNQDIANLSAYIMANQEK